MARERWRCGFATRGQVEPAANGGEWRELLPKKLPKASDGALGILPIVLARSAASDAVLRPRINELARSAGRLPATMPRQY